MKKAKIVLMLIIICSVFVACNNSNSNEFKNMNNNLPYGIETKSSETTELTTVKSKKKNKVVHPEIEKVIVSYYGKTMEIIEEEQSFDFIDKIIKCDSIPDAQLIEQIGKIEIKYYDKDKNEEFAELYIGSDTKIYAKYKKSKNPDYAYQITI